MGGGVLLPNECRLEPTLLAGAGSFLSLAAAVLLLLTVVDTPENADTLFATRDTFSALLFWLLLLLLSFSLLAELLLLSLEEAEFFLNELVTVVLGAEGFLASSLSWEDAGGLVGFLLAGLAATGAVACNAM